jgi:hypothetical protein
VLTWWLSAARVYRRWFVGNVSPKTRTFHSSRHKYAENIEIFSDHENLFTILKTTRRGADRRAFLFTKLELRVSSQTGYSVTRLSNIATNWRVESIIQRPTRSFIFTRVVTSCLARQPCLEALPGSLARQPCPAALPGSLAGSLARQPCRNCTKIITGREL